MSFLRSVVGYEPRRDLPRRLLQQIATRILTAVALLLSMGMEKHGSCMETRGPPNIVLILADDKY